MDDSFIDVQAIIAKNKEILGILTVEPLTRLINLDEISAEKVLAWLDAKHSATWAQYSISSLDSAMEAATWFKKQLEEFYAFSAS